MSTTQKLLSNYILLLLGGASLVGCKENTYCIEVSKEESCPSAEEINQTDLPSEITCGGGQHLKATSEATRTEGGLWSWGEDTASEATTDTCCYTTKSRETLQGQSCVVGRPLLFEGHVQLAKLVPGREWSMNQPAARARALTQLERKIVGQYWLRTARLEHASVASFHQFALDLLRFGAPPELLTRASQSAQDEIQHAQAAFSLAESYLQFPLQPSAWSLKSHSCDTWADFAESIAREAAINETLAVIMAVVQLRKATDPAVRQLLTRIINEEAEHAELAWDTLRWCMREGGPEVRSRLEKIFSEPFTPSAEEFPIEAIYGHGLPSQSEMLAALAQGYEQVIRAAAKSILLTAA